MREQNKKISNTIAIHAVLQTQSDRFQTLEEFHKSVADILECVFVVHAGMAIPNDLINLDQNGSIVSYNITHSLTLLALSQIAKNEYQAVENLFAATEVRRDLLVSENIDMNVNSKNTKDSKDSVAEYMRIRDAVMKLYMNLYTPRHIAHKLNIVE